MATETLASGWYGSESYTYFVTKGGKVWLVQAEDVNLDGGPKVVAEIDEQAEPLPDSVIDAEFWAAVEDLTD